MPPAFKSWLFTLVKARRFCSWQMPLCLILKCGHVAFFTMKHFKMLQGEYLKHGLLHLSRSYLVSGHCWGWQLVLFIEMCSQSQPQYLQVLRLPWEGGIHRDSLRNSLCCFVLWLYENLYETEFSTPPTTLSVGTPCKLRRSWWFTPAIPASMR